MSIFDEEFLNLQHPTDELLLANGIDFLIIFPSAALKNQREWPNDGQRFFPTPIDLQRKWPDT